MIFSFVVGKFGIRKMRKLRHTHNYSRILPNFIALFASESTVPKNFFFDFNTLALVLNRDGDQARVARSMVSANQS